MNLPQGYRSLTVEMGKEYRQYFEALPAPTADLTFTNLWGWAEYFGLGLSFRQDSCWICQTRPSLAFWVPVGDWASMDWEKHPEIRQGVELLRAPEVLGTLLEERLPGRVSAVSDRDQWEYLYNRQELATLPGAKFHKKKTHVNSFRRLYGEDYRSLDAEHPERIEDVLKLQEEWCQWRDCENSPSLRAENDAIFRVMGNWAKMPELRAGALYVDGTVAAFAVGEKVGDMMVVHFEKARTELKGAYQAINYSFVNHSAQDAAIINREQDTGELGLRHAKETYNPVGFLKKCRLVINGDAA